MTAMPSSRATVTPGSIAADIAETYGLTVHLLLRDRGERAGAARAALIRATAAHQGWDADRIDKFFGFAVGESARAMEVPPPPEPPAPVVVPAERATAVRRVVDENRTAASRLVLFELLREVGEAISLTEIHVWSRWMQGQAYLWAIDKKNGWTKPGEPPWRAPEERRAAVPCRTCGTPIVRRKGGAWAHCTGPAVARGGCVAAEPVGEP